jgi:hypothetical protein
MLALLIVLMVVLAVVPAVSPVAGAETADFLRSVFGPQPVAQLESVSYWMRDLVNRSLFASSSGGPHIAWSSTTEAGSETSLSTPGIAPTAAPATSIPPPDQAVSNVLTAPPQVGWQFYAAGPGGFPLMARTMLMVDPDRSFAGVALVRMDLSGLRLHIMAGFLEPAHPSGIDALIPNLGMVGPADRAGLAAAFNGGFKALHGHYGMMVDGVTLLAPVPDMATVAVYRDGSVQMGAWGRDLSSSPDMLAFRQNCPPLVDAGQINPAVSTDARRAWGFTNNSDVTWRTGLGITRDRRYLIYAVGNGTSAEFLAQALLRAGAYMAMQLDINQYYAHFVTYSKTSDSAPAPGETLVAQPLLDKMLQVRELFLVPYPRDFFYLTWRG